MIPAPPPAALPPVWTYADLAEAFGLNEFTIRRRMAEWEREGFPAPLPWSRREKRWNPAAVLGWKARQEQRQRGNAAPLALVINHTPSTTSTTAR